jgi:hypothetical protein
MNNKLPDFLCVPCTIIKNKEMTSLDGLVYGVIYWYSRQKLEKCILGNPVFAKLLDVDPRSIQRSLARLEKCGYVKVLYKDEREKDRTEIIPLVTFQSYQENRDTTTESYQNKQGATLQSYQPTSISKGMTDESYVYDPTVIPIRPAGHTDMTLQSYPIESEVRPYSHHNNIENTKEERVNKRDLAPSGKQQGDPSPKKEKGQVEDTSQDHLIKELLDHHNQLHGTKYIAIKPLRSNFKYWSSTYDLDFMKKASEKILVHHYWKNKMSPDLMLRRKNQRNEEVDYIGELYNYVPEKAKSEPSQSSKPQIRNITQERLARETSEQTLFDTPQRGSAYGAI